MAKQENKTKIALVGYELAQGGQERVLSTVSELLYNSNLDIHIIVLEDSVEYSYSGTLLNLGSYSKYQKYFLLRNYLKEKKIDYVIDFRHRINPFMEVVFLYYIYRNFKTIYTVHTSVLPIHFTNNERIAQLIFDKTHQIVSVSREMNEKIKKKYNFSKGIVIPNCVPEKSSHFTGSESPLPYKYCIAVGRLVAMKQFDKLIESYRQSDLVGNVHLVILGNGEEKERLQNQIENAGLTPFIHLLGFKKNVFEYLKNAEFLVLTSAYEGFGMVILEALMVGTPVVSLDCETGPSEMIIDQYNGLLVANQNFEALIVALNKMHNDTAFHAFCKNNAKNSVAKFSENNIQKRWLDLINS